MQTSNYFDVAALSASGINKFINSSPLHYWMESPFNPDRKPMEKGEALIFGNLCHSLLFEPEKFDVEYGVAPVCDRRTKKGKEDYEAFVAESTGKMVVTQDQFADASKMVEALHRNSAVRDLLTDGKPEGEYYWLNEEGLNCKGKLDYSRDGLIIDYKTSRSASPESFARSIADYGYHRQASWYMDAVELKTGERPKGFVFIVQEKEVPDAIGIYLLDKESIERGRAENLWAAKEINRRLIASEWEAYPALIALTALPNWYKSRVIGE